MSNLTDEMFNSLERRAALRGSLELFTRVFFEIKTGRQFIMSEPIGRESHFITTMKHLKKVFNGDITRLIINMPPGYSKSTMLAYFVAWATGNWPDSNHLYISYAHELAEKHTSTIKEIMELPQYRALFDVELSTDSKARGAFKTSRGGSIKAFGSTGAITGQDAGLPNAVNSRGEYRYSGGVIIDDAHKPDEVHSDTMREKVIENYKQTIKQRPRGPRVPIIFIGQRLHEQDLAAYLLSGADGYDWHQVVLKALDENGNALYPEIDSAEKLRIEERVNPYVFASQFQQCPQPAGGGIFSKDDFVILDEEPRILQSFITCDTAETSKDYNDASVFSFWGVYRIQYRGIDTGMYGLHWLGCREIRVEPKDLESELMDFYAGCMRHRCKPKCIAIERKSTGVTLSSVLKNIQGLRIVDVERTRASGNKTARYLECQPFVASKQISFTSGARHVDMCIEHMRKITANDTHAFDDIADTLQMAIQATLIDGTLLPRENTEQDEVMLHLASHMNYVDSLRMNL